MVLETIKTYLFVGVVGFIVGVIVARIYFKSKIEMSNIGQVIQYAMVHKDITRLRSLTISLDRLVYDIEECSEDITYGLELSKDIEENLHEKEEEQVSN